MNTETEGARFSALLESARLLHGSLELEPLLNHLLRSLMGRLLVRKALVALDADGVLTVAATKGLSSITVGGLFDREEAEGLGVRIFVPIGDHEHPMGVVGIAPPMGAESLDADQHEFIDALLGIAAGGIANARAHQRLEHKVIQLRTLLDTGRGFASCLDPEAVAQLLGLTLSGQWLMRKYAILAWKKGQPDVVRQKGCSALVANPAVRDGVAALGDSGLVVDLAEGPFREALVSAQIAAFVPLRSGDSNLGLLALGTRGDGKAYTTDDLDYASVLAAQAAVAFDNSWNFRETLEKRKLEKELELAADIQRRLLPASIPQIRGFDIAARSKPARQVGGDYYDSVPVDAVGPEHPYVACVADVSGKGIGAALLMSSIQASLRALVSPSTSLPFVVRKMNDLIHATTAANKYATSFFMQLNPVTRELGFVNAGHNDGLVVRRDGSVERLKASGTPVGLMPGRSYALGELKIGEGDIVALYSDGVTEANDPDENEFTDDRLIECLRANAGKSAEGIVADVFAEVDAFQSTAPQYDDITLMIIKSTE